MPAGLFQINEASHVLDSRGSPFMSPKFGDKVGTGTDFIKPSGESSVTGRAQFLGNFGDKIPKNH